MFTHSLRYPSICLFSTLATLIFSECKCKFCSLPYHLPQNFSRRFLRSLGLSLLSVTWPAYFYSLVLHLAPKFLEPQLSVGLFVSVGPSAVCSDYFPCRKATDFSLLSLICYLRAHFRHVFFKEMFLIFQN